VPPAIALEQRTARSGANSTVATVTEVAHYLRLLYAKVGEMHCPRCEAVVRPTSPDALFARLLATPGRGASTVYAPAVRARKGTYLDLFNEAARAGVTWARVDGALVPIDPPPKLLKTKEHTIDLVVFTGPLADLDREGFDRALSFGAGGLRVAPGKPTAAPGPKEEVCSTARACSVCGTGVPELDPRWFSFNTKQGQCEHCEGRGHEGDPEDETRDEERQPCRACGGSRLSPVPRRVRLDGLTYGDFTRGDVSAALRLARAWTFSGHEELIAKAPHGELLRRLSFVEEVGLGYLALDRPARTLSGGEMQRLRLSAQLGSGLTGALYVLDEPTIGLHPRDTQKLIGHLRALVDTGSTVLVVEHDEETIRAADHLIDIGPSGGRGGGRIVAEGSAAQVLGHPDSPTGRAFADDRQPARPERKPPEKWLHLLGARAHNLKGVDLRVPVGRLCVVAGVSGSGKSTLVRQVFYPALRQALGLVADRPLPFASLTGVGPSQVKRALAVDQSPIGRTPRSVPATFLGVWDGIRKLYAGLPESRLRGYSAQRFSFNTGGGGRCPVCEGQGVIVSEMAFLPDVSAPCEACGDPWHPLPWPAHRRGPAPVGGRGGGALRPSPAHRPAADHSVRPGGGLRAARAGVEHPVRRRGAAPEAGGRADRGSRPRAHGLRAGRAHHRPAPDRRTRAAGRTGRHPGHHRTPARRHRRRRLGDRTGPRGRRGRGQGGLRGAAGAAAQGAHGHRPLPGRTVRPEGGGQGPLTDRREAACRPLLNREPPC
jgi:excinuclease ABC subunit A